jgi:diguanylate cyclase (GGDEF)-like protein
VDIPTLFFVEATLLFLFGATMLVDSIGQRAQAGNYWFAASNFCGAVGLVIRPFFPHAIPLVATVIPNFLLFVELSLLNKAIAEFVERARNLWLGFLALSVLMAATTAHLTVAYPNNNTLIVQCISVMTISTAVCNAWLLFRYSPNGIRIPVFTMAVLFSLYAFNNLLRTGTAFLLPNQRFYHIWLDRTILSGLSVGYLLMTNARLRQRLVQQASIDPLTGVLNRRAFEQEALKLIESNRRAGRPVSALMLDLDRFKQINDTYGHHAGDLALQGLADCLRKTIRTSDLIIRLGGDEFLVILSGITRAQAYETADRLCEHLSELRIVTQLGEFGIQTSIGVISLDHQELQLDRLMKLGDQELYTAKAARVAQGLATTRQDAM